MTWSGIYFPAVLAAAVACMVLGFVWYSPLLFARPWTIAMGMDPDDKVKMAEMQKGAGKLYGAAFLASLLGAMLLSKLLAVMGIRLPLYGMKIGAAVWVGFVMPVQLTGTLFGMRSLKVFFIDTGYQLVCYLAMGAILAVWRPL